MTDHVSSASKAIDGWVKQPLVSNGRKRYLFIRLLEACNADCFMCHYALSKDRYRFTLAEFLDLLPQTRAGGIAFVRFTGGEPLLHKEFLGFIEAAEAAGLKSSVITNGALLPRMIGDLARAGLTQVIVSIDGATAASHDRFRNTELLFDRGIAGLRMARDLGVLTRVNTVVGPHNFDEMPALQRLLTELGVGQWELSAIKLERPIAYGDFEHVRTVCDPLYEGSLGNRLIPMGKRFYGETKAEQVLFFSAGCTPRASMPCCHLVGDVIYLDPKAGRGYGCSLLPHRHSHESRGGAAMRHDGCWILDMQEFQDHVTHFRLAGPAHCTGCSSTAAGYSDAVAEGADLPDWSF